MAVRPDFATVYEYKCTVERCGFRWFSLAEVHSARCPKCWAWAVSEPTTVTEPDDWLMDG